MPRVTINGEERTVVGATVADMLAELGLSDVRLAVEVNRRVVPKDRHTAHELEPGDAVEIVTFVGGG